MAELAIMGIPALLVPVSSLPRNHQEPNARVFSEHTGCPWVTEREWSLNQIGAIVKSRLLDPAAYAQCREKLVTYAMPDAAEAIADLCDEYLGRSTQSPVERAQAA